MNAYDLAIHVRLITHFNVHDIIFNILARPSWISKRPHELSSCKSDVRNVKCKERVTDKTHLRTLYKKKQAEGSWNKPATASSATWLELWNRRWHNSLKTTGLCISPATGIVFSIWSATKSNTIRRCFTDLVQTLRYSRLMSRFIPPARPLPVTALMWKWSSPVFLRYSLGFRYIPLFAICRVCAMDFFKSVKAASFVCNARDGAIKIKTWSRYTQVQQDALTSVH